MIGRRVKNVKQIKKPGDYCRVNVNVQDKLEDCVFFVPPNSPTDGDWPRGHLHQVRQPPHVFRECDDGSLEIRESIGCGRTDGEEGYSWHGYLDEGNVWREVP